MTLSLVFESLMKALSDQEISQHLETLPSWKLNDGKLLWEHEFSDFKQAFGFMTQLALYAEQENHHPEWFNVYNRLRIELQTHDLQGISLKDIEFAKTCEDYLKKV